MTPGPAGGHGVVLTLTADEVTMLSNALLELREMWDWEYPIRTGFSLQDYEQLHGRLLGMAGRRAAGDAPDET